jgi:hypothetical protein
MDFDALVERWWNDHFPGSAAARDTAAWNVAFAAKEELKRRLAGPIVRLPPSEAPEPAPIDAANTAIPEEH